MFKLSELKYELNALEPAISQQIMDLHYNKHHAGYVKKLNDALETAGVSNDSLANILANMDDLPEFSRQAIRNNGGGHYNHSLFWEMMTDQQTEPSQFVIDFLDEHFGGLEGFKAAFNEQATSLFGSGWVWLMSSGEILTTPNQDSPVMDGREDILLALDVWEHAYYLDYRNDRKQYIEAWWGVVNWGYVSDKLASL